jgi:RND superfamily putative drug exporter
MSQLLRRLGNACAAHPLRVIAAWVAAAGIATALSLTIGGTYTQHEKLPGTQVQAGLDELTAHFPAAAGESADVVLHARDGRAATLAPILTDARQAIGALPHVASVSPQLSPDGTTAWLQVHYDVDRFGLRSRDLTWLRQAAQAGRSLGVDGYVTGVLYLDFNTPSAGIGEKVGVGVAVIVLLFAFGSVIAALMPLATAAVGIVTGLALVRMLALVYSVNDTAPELATMIGLGVGIDYALFVVTRHRESMRAGVAPQTAAASAIVTAGSSVLWAGITVVAAICGLAFAGIPVMTSLGFAAAIVVACSAAAALTMLPALLSLTDRHIDGLHLSLPHLRHGSDGQQWARWARAIERRPVRFLAIGAAVMIVLAVPVAGLRLGMPDGSSAASTSDAHRAFVLLADNFGAGVNGELQVVVALPAGQPARSVGQAVHAAVMRDREVASASPMTVSPDGTIGVLTVIPRSGPQTAAAESLVPRLRAHVLAPVASRLGARTWVTGVPAGRYDVGQRVLDRLPWFVGAVLAVSFLLLMLVFRSVLVPLKAVLLNLLSIAGALGVVVAVFTWGWLRQLVGVPETVPLVDVIPMLMFAIVFGLSMDYEVFLLSRVREEWLIGGDGKGSVVRGLSSTARVITAAAAIMVCVFLSFTLSGDVVVKMMGVGLAVAVLLDATVIRLVLVPATMSLLGDLNWWVPRWLDRVLPHIDIEGAVPLTPYDVGQVTEVPMARPTA